MTVSAVRKAGIAARVAGRIAARQAAESRSLVALWRGVRVTATSFGRVLGTLWLEVTGFVFLFLSVVGGLALSREYTKYVAGKTSSLRVVLAVCFTVTFAWFGLSSFWRARKRS
ncbi:MAG TPA: hypothetical protein VFI95_15440 [Terriglobales bacterium]|nr:hypothetical protein [Terriglobales bacterium]